MSEWKSAEQPPDEGVRVLAYVPEAGFYGHVLVVVRDDGEWWHYAGDDTDEVHPTHWMPLPDPPVNVDLLNAIVEEAVNRVFTALQIGHLFARQSRALPILPDKAASRICPSIWRGN